ncbi:hypothetical protein G3A43_08805 [Paraburkholderia aspalathi]|nr:hypothetical protein [Paraburkholderia aspalathi]MBK3780357.1 hypothetical protein [Paraburkholderia aspalathi]
MDKFKMEALAMPGSYVVLRNDVSVMAATTSESHAKDITDALNGVELATQRDRWNAVNSMALMFGMLQASTSPQALVAGMQEASGEGFIDGLTELAPLAVKVTEVELALYAAAEARNEGFPGVFQYEVTEDLGAYVKELLSGSKDCLLDHAMEYLGNLALKFMASCSDEGTVVPEYVAAISGVLPDWKAPSAS